MSRKSDGFFRVNGIYYARVPDEKTGELVRQSSKTDDLEKAKEWRDRLRHHDWQRKRLGINTVDWTVKELIDWAWENEWSKPSWANKKSIYSTLKRPLEFFGSIVSRKLTIREIEHYVEIRRNEVKASSINKEMSYLRSAFNQAIRKDRLLDKNPFSQIQSFNELEFQRSVNATPEQQMALIQESTGIVHDVVEFAFDTGLRKGEIEALKWADVHFESNQIRVVSRKGRKGSINIRFVPIFENALAVLNRRPRISEYVFCNEEGKPIPRDGAIHAGFPRLTARLNMPDFHFHDIRHTFGTNYYRMNKDIASTAMVLGHGNNVTTTMRYLNLSYDDLMPKESGKLYPWRPKSVLPKNAIKMEVIDNQASAVSSVG